MRPRSLLWAIGRPIEVVERHLCECEHPEIVPVGGIWHPWHVCVACQRPPAHEVRARAAA